MEAIRHLLVAVLFCGVFFLGKMMVERRRKLADKMADSLSGKLIPESTDPEKVSDVLLYSGRSIQTFGAIAGFLEVVAFLVLVF